MRITQGIMMRQYNNRLNQITSSLNKANERVLTQRKFTSGAENPAQSIKSGQLRRDYAKNKNYLENSENVKDRLEMATANVIGFNKSAVTAYTLTLGADSKHISEREIIATELDNLAQTLLQEANANVGGQFVLGGSGTQDIPFKLVGGEITFRGIPVSSTDPDDQAILKTMANEKIYVDLGFGLKIDDNGVIDSGSAFNTATPGINYLGYGTNGDGTSKNIIETISAMADMLRGSSVDENEFQTLAKNLDEQKAGILAGMTSLGTQSKFLDTTIKRLTDNEDILNNKIKSTEFIPLEQAITEFQMQDATYRAALKMGNSILSVSLMDFMR